MGRPPLPKSKVLGDMLTLPVSRAMVRQLDALAKLRGVSRARAARDVLENGITAAIRKAERDAEKEFG
jgi:hypothetical protein